MRPWVPCFAVVAALASVTVAHADTVDTAYTKWRAALPRTGVADSAAKRRTRAGLLASLAASARSTVAGTAGRAFDALIQVALTEPHRPLRAFAGVELLRLEKAMSAAQATRYAAVKGAMFPLRPPTPTTGAILIRHFVGDEFYRGELAAYRRRGFTVDRDTGTSARARKDRLTVTLRKGDADIFRDMNDGKVDVVIFSGHSDVGGVTEQALRLAPREKGQKLIVMLQCVGMQVVPMVSARFERAQILTTREPSYADLDLNMTSALLEGLQRNDDWAAIRRRAKAGADASNYVLPDDPAIAIGWDLDRDGQIDAVVSQQIAPSVILHNVTPSAGNSLVLKLVGRTCCRTPVTARVTLRGVDPQACEQLVGGGGHTSMISASLAWTSASSCFICSSCTF